MFLKKSNGLIIISILLIIGGIGLIIILGNEDRFRLAYNAYYRDDLVY